MPIINHDKMKNGEYQYSSFTENIIFDKFNYDFIYNLFIV